MRGQTVSALTQLGQSVLPHRMVDSVVSSLGMTYLSDNYQALARALDARLFVEGVVLEKQRRLFAAHILVRDSSGVLLGRVGFSGPGLPALLTTSERELLPRLQAILKTQSSGRPGAPLVTQSASRAASNAKQTAALRTPPDSDSLAVDEDLDEADVDVPPRSRARAREGRGRSPVNRFDLALGTQIYFRNFEYSDNGVGGQQDHKIAGVPAPNLALDYFPWPFFGIALSGEYSVPRVSRDAQGRGYELTSFAYSAGVKFRMIGDGSELVAGGAFGENSFAIADGGEGANRPQVADVAYRQVKLGASGRIALGTAVSLVGGGNYLHLLELGELSSATYFPRVTGKGLDAHLGFAVRFLSMFEARATANLRRYALDMNSLEEDKRQAKSAVDRYLGFNLILAVRD